MTASTRLISARSHPPSQENLTLDSHAGIARPWSRVDVNSRGPEEPRGHLGGFVEEVKRPDRITPLHLPPGGPSLTQAYNLQEQVPLVNGTRCADLQKCLQPVQFQQIPAGFLECVNMRQNSLRCHARRDDCWTPGIPGLRTVVGPSNVVAQVCGV
jgi:hypothetical protein